MPETYTLVKHQVSFFFDPFRNQEKLINSVYEHQQFPVDYVLLFYLRHVHEVGRTLRETCLHFLPFQSALEFGEKTVVGTREGRQCVLNLPLDQTYQKLSGIFFTF